MYPFVRLAKELAIHRAAPPLGIGEWHVTQLVCWPSDIDLWMELNNGRTLTMMDLGRVVMFKRMGVVDIMRRNRWAGSIVGGSIRYRRRVRMFDRLELRSRLLGWDERFSYVEQSFWRNGECTSHALLRMALSTPAGIVQTADFCAEMGISPDSPTLPEWVTAWVGAEKMRPWPPER